MGDDWKDYLRFSEQPKLVDGTMILSFSGWMDGGDVSTGTVERLVEGLSAKAIASIDIEPFYIFNFPGSMEIAALFRPYATIQDGVVADIEMPSNTFFCEVAANLVLFIGKEPNLRWRSFGQCIFHVARQVGVNRILFVGSYGGTVPHTREPRLYVTCSEPSLRDEMEVYGVRRTGYEGPGSFVTYLMTQAAAANLRMVSLVAEIPSYLQGTNPLSIEAVMRRLAKILQLPLDLDPLRSASTKWELEVSQAIEQDEELAATVRQLEEAYDNELLSRHGDDGGE